MPKKNTKVIGEFHTKVVGVTHDNDDGSNRQKILKKCRVGEELQLIHTPIPQDKNAVKVCRRNGQQIGWLSRSVAEEIAPRLRKGGKVRAQISSLTGGGLFFKRTRGCNIKIMKYNLR